MSNENQQIIEENHELRAEVGELSYQIVRSARTVESLKRDNSLLSQRYDHLLETMYAVLGKLAPEVDVKELTAQYDLVKLREYALLTVGSFLDTPLSVEEEK